MERLPNNKDFSHIDDRLERVSRSAILVGLDDGGYKNTGSKPLEELELLAETASLAVLDKLVQKSRHKFPATYIGSGKVKELHGKLMTKRANIVVFDNDLTPAQVKNLEKELRVRVMDRSELILEIFALHAKSSAAKIQVELAQLEYTLPRLRNLWLHLDRERGGTGTRGGAGEQQIEMDRRRVTHRISQLKNKLKEISSQKKRTISSRKDSYKISLVGYTNAGKSTLMNRLTGADVKEGDQLFLTLDTKTNRWRLNIHKTVLLSDTVGFIRNIPHNLIASFQATLEEAKSADLLLHVADASSPNPVSQINAVNKVLVEIGCEAKPTLLCLNKIDCLGDKVEIEYLKSKFPNSVEISAQTGEGIDVLEMMVCEQITKGLETFELIIDPSLGKTISEIARRGEIHWQKMIDGQFHIYVSIEKKLFDKIDPKKEIRVVDNPTA